MTETVPKSIHAIIEAAGGFAAVAQACREGNSKLTIDAVYKWPTIGIPDRHWPYIMPLAGATAEEMLAANLFARETAS